MIVIFCSGLEIAGVNAKITRIHDRSGIPGTTTDLPGPANPDARMDEAH